MAISAAMIAHRRAACSGGSRPIAAKSGAARRLNSSLRRATHPAQPVRRRAGEQSLDAAFPSTLVKVSKRAGHQPLPAGWHLADCVHNDFVQSVMEPAMQLGQDCLMATDTEALSKFVQCILCLDRLSTLGHVQTGTEPTVRCI